MRCPNQAAIDSAAAGADAVVSASGPSTDRKAVGLPLVAGTGHIRTAMKRHNVRCFLPQMGRMTAGVHQAVTANTARIKAEGTDRWADLLRTTMP
ncbi:hypothetical protein AB0B78_39290 [Streptomyces sp. NPDC040724]|uniref:hypothetical protein n=1 Tax=unclassified Streptomyces TaxID=2593676 RepID=UPI00340AB8E4